MEALPEGDGREFHAALHRLARGISGCEAYYFARWRPADGMLVYVYNVDEVDLIDYPDAFPLTDGPTSWVVRHERTLWLDVGRERPTDLAPLAPILFGNMSRRCAAAVHLPVRTAPPPAALYGVVGALHYSPGAFDEKTVGRLEWLADQLGRRIAVSLSGGAMEAARRDGALATARAAARGIQNALRLMDEDPARAAAALRDLQDALVLDAEPDAEVALSPREREAARLAADGRSNKEIAAALGVEVSTVKTQLAAVRQKTGLGRSALGRLFRD